MKACFESQNIGLLQETIAKMPEKDAAYHMKRCIDSGLWVPDSKSKKSDPESEEAEGVYEEVNSVESAKDTEPETLGQEAKNEKDTKDIVEETKSVNLGDN